MSLGISAIEIQAATPGPPSFASNYQLVFNQDFTAMTSLSQLGVSASSMGSGTWVAHTPTNQDYFTFENPSANNKPFGVGNGYLAIRVQQDGNDPNNWFDGFSGGLLSSMDSSGAGFAQKYGYFECSAWTPGTPNTWPAFWLLSAPNLTNNYLPFLAEIDIMEAYGNYQTGAGQTPPGNPNSYSVAWHNWGKNGNTTAQDGIFLNKSGLTAGYHTYGVDVEPNGISWYFDRQLVWQAPIYPAAQQPLLAMVNLALGGGNYNNAGGTAYDWSLTPNPTDLKVQYVAVWASPSSPNYVTTSIPATPTGLVATGGSAQIALAWNSSSGVTSYNLLRGTSSGSEKVVAAGIAGGSYTDSTVSAGTTYYYQVIAVNSLGASGASNEASGTSTGAAVPVAIPAPPPFGSNYQLVFSQDFTTMTSLSQLGVSASTIGKGSWIAHTPTNQDFFTFENPAANYQPFGVGNGYLDIRVQQDGNDPHNWFSGFSGGLLSSLDSSGAGFAQQYGYFECSLWPPSSSNVWPAFWLLSAPNITNSALPHLAEIDIMESYGNYQTGANQTPPGNPNAYSVAWHNWGQNGTDTTQAGIFFNESGMTAGYHTYGVDVEPSGLSWYFDRKLVWQAPIYAAAQQPLLVMVDLALGGGDYNNSTGTAYDWALTPNPADLKVQYVAVWASPMSPNYKGSGVAAAPTGLSASVGGGQVGLAWSGSASATSYNILRGTTSGGETIIASGIVPVSYTDTAPSGGTYYYEVTAVNGLGASSASNEVTASSTTISGTAPAAPSGLSAAGSAPVSLAWTGSSNAASYNVLRGTSSGSETALATGVTSASYIDNAVVNGTIYYYEIVAVNGYGTSSPSNEANVTPAAGGGGGGPLPSPWLSQDVGVTWTTGNSSYASGTFSLNGAGNGAYYLPDRFQFAYQTVTGDGSITARVVTQANSNRYAGAGVMIRDGLANNSGFADTILYPNNGGAVFQYRGDASSPTTVSGNGMAPYWVKITRTGNTFASAVSPDGITWTTLGNTTLVMPATAYIGLIQASGVDGRLATSTFDNVSITNSAGRVIAAVPAALSATAAGGQIDLMWGASPGATSYNILRNTSAGSETVLTYGVASSSYIDSSVAIGTEYYYQVQSVDGAGTSSPSNEASAIPAALSVASGAIPSVWLNQDVGTTEAVGNATYADGTFVLNGAGGGAFLPPDGFQFVYQAMSGDCSILARVVTEANSNPYAHAGVMIRDGLSDNSEFADVTLYPNGGGALFQNRGDAGNPVNVAGIGGAPYWVKVTRVGNTFTGFVSPDGTSWKMLGAMTLTMPFTVYVGLLEASGINGTLATSTFDHVSTAGTADGSLLSSVGPGGK